MSITDGELTITADGQGNSGGLAWNPGQLYGRWEGCAKAPPAAEAYNALLLLWPDAEDWPSGGEIDFMEIVDPARQNSEFWLHYGPDDKREFGNLRIDAAQWHSWAVEWNAVAPCRVRGRKNVVGNQKRRAPTTPPDASVHTTR